MNVSFKFSYSNFFSLRINKLIIFIFFWILSIIIFIRHWNLIKTSSYIIQLFIHTFFDVVIKLEHIFIDQFYLISVLIYQNICQFLWWIYSIFLVRRTTSSLNFLLSFFLIIYRVWVLKFLVPTVNFWILIVNKIIMELMLLINLILIRQSRFDSLALNMRIIVWLFKNKDIRLVLFIKRVDRGYILSVLCQTFLWVVFPFRIRICYVAIGPDLLFPFFITVIVNVFIIWTVFLAQLLNSR